MLASEDRAPECRPATAQPAAIAYPRRRKSVRLPRVILAPQESLEPRELLITELATFTDAAVVGIVPEQIKNESGMLASLSSVLNLKADDIKAKYNASWVRPDSFVPVKTLSGPAFNTLRPRLSVIEGVQIQPERVRSYPTGLASQLIRYALDESRSARRKVRPFCPFVRSFIARHPEYLDLVGEPERFGLAR